MIVHGVAWSGSNRIRYGSCARSSASTIGPITSVSQRSSASTFTCDEPLVPGFVGCLDVQHEQVAIVERVDARMRLRGVVVVEAGGRAGNVDDLDAGEHAEALHEIDRRRHAARDAVRRRRTAGARASRLDPTTRSASPTAPTSRGDATDDGARRVHQRAQLAAPPDRSGTPPACR